MPGLTIAEMLAASDCHFKRRRRRSSIEVMTR
jgi:hypothetical protein